MFVKHIEERNFIDEGFETNPVTRETFSKQQVDSDSVSSYVQVWLGVNTYRYKAVTDKEGTVEYGHIRNKEDLREVNKRFFENREREFLKRQLPSKMGRKLDSIQLALLNAEIEIIRVGGS